MSHTNDMKLQQNTSCASRNTVTFSVVSWMIVSGVWQKICRLLFYGTCRHWSTYHCHAIGRHSADHEVRCDILNVLRQLTLYAIFLSRDLTMHLRCLSFLHTDISQIVKILPRVRQGPTYFTESIPGVLMAGRRKEPGHQQPRYWHS